MMSFKDLGLHPQLLKAIDKLGYTEATDVQKQAVPPACAGKDVLVSAKTGSGKTASFILPMLDRFLSGNTKNESTRALILLPTRELALQTQKAFQSFAAFTSIKSGIIIGGEAYKHQVASIRKNPEVIIATPGRLVDHIEKGNMDFGSLEVLVLDEADRMLDMGFAEAMLTIMNSCNTQRQNLLFSATLRHKGFKQLQDSLSDPVFIRVDKAVGHSHITQQIVLADDDRHKESLIAALIEQEESSRTFVFCNTRLQAQKLSNLLRAKKIRSAYIHGEVAQSDRKQVLNQFKDGKLQVLVATDVAARGLDIKDVDLVINFTVPQSGDDHVHRVGRTGRAGNTGKAITLVNSSEWNQMSSIERYLKIRFEVRKVKGFEAKYTGPGKLKKSGKAAGPKKKKGGQSKKDQTKKKRIKTGKAKPARTEPKSDDLGRGQSTHSNEGGNVPLRRKKPPVN